MGQGYSVTTLSAGSAGIDVPELADLMYERSLGNARFMKSIRARHKDGLVVAKIVPKAYSGMKMDPYIKILLHERKVLADIPNARGYHRILETATSGYLVRQYIHSSLYDRLSTRPFLEDIEKKWIAFQLLCAVRDCHAQDVFHGDIKSENILLTSWSWLYLSDFSSSFKPVYLPEDNPADFSFYFDIAGRRTCYLAPERFVSAGTPIDNNSRINWAMDIFSVGCVIAELFVETPIFTLSQIFKYKQGEYDPDQAHLSKINDPEIREMVRHMISVEPDSRYAADEYLNFWRKRAFPDYFYNFLHQYMYTITDPTSGRKPVTSHAENMGESDERIEKLYNDFDKISYSLGFETPAGDSSMKRKEPRLTGSIFPLHVDIPNYKHRVQPSGTPTLNDGVLIFLTLVVASVRSTARATARVQACELLLAFSERMTDEAKLDRVLPFLLAMTDDESDLVTVAALRALTQVLETVKVVSPMNTSIFTDYILPSLERFVLGHKTKPSALLRMTYAACLASLATTASRFFQVMQSLHADGSLPKSDPDAEANQLNWSLYEQLYDVSREDLTLQLEVQTTAILADSDLSVRRAFLGSVASLCSFFGNAKSNDVVLSHLNTYLNDDDWQLKCAFFETIVGVATYVGTASLEEFILPLIVQALTDPEDFVVERAIRALSTIADLGLFQASTLWDLVDVIGRFTMHPNAWIREGAAQFLATTAKYASTPDIYCIVMPLIKPFLRFGMVSSFTELNILAGLKKPLPRVVLEMATNWALSAEKGLFWSTAAKQKIFTDRVVDKAYSGASALDLGPASLGRLAKTEEDEMWLSKLRNAGMSTEDEMKLLALREYIWRVAHRRPKGYYTQAASIYNQVVPLKDLKVKPQTVFFEDIHETFRQGLESTADTKPPVREKMPRTISDALLDASTTDALDMHRASSQAGITSQPRPIDGSPRAPTSPALMSEDTSADESSRRGSVRASRVGAASPSNMQSPVGSVGTLKPPQSKVRHKGSAINLLNRGDSGSKATAATSTTSENAFGSVGGNNSREPSVRRRAASPALAVAQQKNRAQPSNVGYQAAHTYTGRDPSVLKLLDMVFLENYPADYAEFGPLVAPISGLPSTKASGGLAGQPGNIPWKPEGRLVALLGEHTAAVTRIVVAPDHAFFATGSTDGNVKIWDSERLERSLAHRSKLTYQLSDGVAVTSMCFIENTYCIAIAGSDGSVHIIKIPVSRVKETTRFGRVQVMREYQLPENEHATWSEHYKSDNQSLLLMTTTASRVVALDLRTMTESFVLNEPVRHGALTCFCLDQKNRHWMLIGTSHGILSLWDLRFKYRLKSWGFPGFHPITRILPPPGSRRSTSRKVYISGGTGPGEVTAWDIEKQTCTTVYRTSSASSSTSKSFTLTDLTDEPSGAMLRRFAANTVGTSSSLSSSEGIRAMAIGAHTPSDGSEPRNFFLLTSGPDWKIRYWDPPHPSRESQNQSLVISGLALDEPQPTYTVSNAPGGTETYIVTEKSAESKEGKEGKEREREGRKGKKGVVSVQEQHLLKGHLDSITDVGLVERPFGMVISGDRAGMTYVWK